MDKSREMLFQGYKNELVHYSFPFGCQKIVQSTEESQQ